MRLIVGGDSTIGKALSSGWKRRRILFKSSSRRPELVSNDRPFIDLNLREWNVIKEYEFEVAILCAAITSLEECNKNPKTTREVNVVRKKEMAKDLVDKDIHIIMISSNQVFDGEKPLREVSEPTNPKTEYGKQLEELEKYLISFPKTTILRLSKVVHPNLSILKEWKIKLEKGKKIYPFNDLTLSPIPLEIVVKNLEKIIVEKIFGVKQFSSETEITYEEFAYDFCKKIGANKELIYPISFKEKETNLEIYSNYNSLKTSEEFI